MEEQMLTKSSKLQFTEDLRSQSPLSTPTEKFYVNPDVLGTFMTRSISAYVKQMPRYQITALRYLYVREQQYESVLNYVPEDQVRYQISLLLQSHFSLRMRESALAIELQFLMRTMKLNEAKYDFAVKLVSILHVADKYEPSAHSLRLAEKIIRLFGSACFKLQKSDLLAAEEQLLEEIDYEINYVTAFNYLDLFATVADLDRGTRLLATYLVLLCMCDVNLYSSRPSLVCATCISLAFQVQTKQHWSNGLYFWTGYSEQMIEMQRPLVSAVWKYGFTAGMRGSPSALFKAYSGPQACHVSLISPL